MDVYRILFVCMCTEYIQTKTLRNVCCFWGLAFDLYRFQVVYVAKMQQ